MWELNTLLVCYWCLLVSPRGQVIKLFHSSILFTVNNTLAFHGCSSSNSSLPFVFFLAILDHLLPGVSLPQKSHKSHSCLLLLSIFFCFSSPCSCLNSQSFAWLLSFSLITFSLLWHLPIPPPQTSFPLSLAILSPLSSLSLILVTSFSTSYLSPSPYSLQPTWISSSMQ